MQSSTLPYSRDLVLIGGGHSHALVLRKWGMNPLPGARLTLINPGPTAPYSGMLPGFVAGHYDREELDIDLVRLARFAGARLILGAATAIDPIAKKIAVEGHPNIGYDVAAIDVGITSDMPDLEGFSQFAVPAKPLGPFARNWHEFLQSNAEGDVAVIGGGVAGVELAMAMAHALAKANKAGQVVVLEKETALGALRRPAAEKIRDAMVSQSIEIVENAGISRLRKGAIHFEDGSHREFAFVTGAAGAKPYEWLGQSSLEHKNGFLTVNENLQTSDPTIFATGDCAHMAFDPRPKAGVYAVRQAPVLERNLRAALTGGAMTRYRPQGDYLKLISLGEKNALGDRLKTSFSGNWVWRWKDHIDQKFMNKFRDLPKMSVQELPREHALGVDDALGGKPLCGGCGAKLGRDALDEALALLPQPNRTDVTPLPYDDAALLTTGGAQQVMTTDHLRSFWPDAAVMARIAALHALGDVWAMGADPQAVTVNVTLPRMADQLARRTMAEIMEVAADTIRDAGAEIVGGHSTMGDELTIGFAVTGLCEKPPVTLAGAKPGDALILTKPIGTGVIMAAEMAGDAKGEWVAGALKAMQHEQGSAAQVLREHAHAMTDVTGFGLAGHAHNICVASGVAATLDMASILTLEGALELAEMGVQSSLFASNRQGFTAIPSGGANDLLFDPQTGGGLLAAVPLDKAEELISALQGAGHVQSALVGRVTEGPAGQVSIS